MKPYYSDGLVTIYHGNAADFEVPAEVMLTDPPYGIDGGKLGLEEAA